MHPDPEARCDQLRQCFGKKSELSTSEDGK
jgi:hypothetical protein